MATYGWYLRHPVSGKFALMARTANEDDLADILFVVRPQDATCFETRSEAQSFASLMDHPPELIDFFIPDPSPADADQTPIPSFEDVMRQVHVRNEAEREAARHAGSNAVLSDAPPIGELAREQAAQKPRGYGVGGFGRPQW